VHVVDWLPTLLEAASAGAGQPIKAPTGVRLDGVSLVPLLRGEAMAERALFWHAPLYDLRWGATPCAVVRRGDWKLIEYFGDHFDAEGRYVLGKHVELFNLREDLSETKNVAEREPARAGALTKELHGFLEDCQVEIPGPNPHHDPARAFEEAHAKPDFLK
jgi:arylsulfatase A-like enzyme